MLPLMRPLTLTLLLATLAPIAAYAQDTPEIPFDPAPTPKPRPTPSPIDAPQPEAEAMPMLRSSGGADEPPAPDGVVETPVETEAPEEEEAPSVGRESATRLAPSYSAETGVLRTIAAEGPEAGSVRLLFGIDFFSSSSFFRADDSASRVGGVLGVAFVPINHLELWINTRAQSTQSTLTRPQLIQSLGDVSIGAKGFFRVGDAVSLGADMQGTFLAGVGSQSFDAAQLTLRALATFDLSRTESQIPIRAHLNLGGVIDGSSNLVPQQLSDAESFAQSAGDFSRFTTGISVEVPVRYVTPYLEYTLEVPVGYLATPGIILTGATQQALRTTQVSGASIASDPGRPGLGRVMPQRLTPGVRVTALPDLTLDLAIEIGLTPDTAPGVVAVAPYNVVFMMSYALDPFARRSSGPPTTIPIVIPEMVASEPPASTGLVTGVVVGQDGAPIDGVVVGFDRAPPVATADNGRFLSHEIEPGTVKLSAKKEGFEPATADVSVTVGQTQEVKIALIAQVKDGIIRGRVADTQGKTIGGASVDIQGPTSGSISTDSNGKFEKSMPGGEYLAVVNASGYYRAGRRVQLEKGAQQNVDLTVRPRPAAPIAEVVGSAVRLKKRITFTSDDQLAPASAEVLDAVADLLWARPDLKLRVEAHWDNSISESDAQRKTTTQANAVLAYLSAQGIGADRVNGDGIGGAKPIAPNITQRGRDQNKRVEILVR